MCLCTSVLAEVLSHIDLIFLTLSSSGSTNGWPHQIWPYPHRPTLTSSLLIRPSYECSTKTLPGFTASTLTQTGDAVVVWVHSLWCETPEPRVPHCLPHNCTADALASTGAVFWRDHLGIFRFWNPRALTFDWLRRPHDNLGRNLSCVLSPSVSLEGSWGGFGGLGDH